MMIFTSIFFWGYFSKKFREREIPSSIEEDISRRIQKQTFSSIPTNTKIDANLIKEKQDNENIHR